MLRATIAAIILLVLPGGTPARADVLVCAASSLTDVMQTIAGQFEAATGERVVLNLAASNTLARQILAGARVDVFLSADEAQMDRVTALLARGSRIDLLSNRLAIAVARGSTAIRGPQDLASPATRRIAIGDPAAVPAGVYARQYLERAGLWSLLESRLVPTGSVRLALAAVESGAADAAIVYATDVASARRARTAFVVPPTDGPAIRYPAAVMATAPNAPGARRFLAYLRSPDAARVFAAAGFGVLVTPGTPGRP